MASLQSNLKVITSGKAPTTSNLGKGAMAFGKVGDTYRIYGNSEGTEVHEYLALSPDEQSKLANVPANTNSALAGKADKTTVDELTTTVNSKADSKTVDDLTKTVSGKLDSVVAGTNVVIDDSDKNNPVINVATVDLPDKYSSTESQTGAVGGSKTGLDYSALSGIGTQKAAGEGDTVVFANGVQAQITAVSGKTYDAIIVSTPIATSWGTITGTLSNQTDLKDALDLKANKTDIPTVKDSKVTLKDGNSEIGSFTLNGNAATVTRNIFKSTASAAKAVGETASVDTSSLTAIDGDGAAKAGDLVAFADYRLGKVVSVAEGAATVAVIYAPRPQDPTSWGNIEGTLNNQADLKEALDAKANKSDLPTVNNAKVTVMDGETQVASFTLNQAEAATVSLPAPTLVVEEI